MCFLLDRQKKVLEVVLEHFPLTINRFCTRHIEVNFKKKWFSMLLKMLLWRITNSTNMGDFNNAMHEIELHKKEVDD